MKTKFLYISVLIFILISCNFEDHNHFHRLEKHTVYVIPQEGSTLDNDTEIIPESTSYVDFLLRNYDLVNVLDIDSSIQVELRYSDTTNFLHYNLYHGLKNAYLNCETALKLSEAQYYLKMVNPDLSLIVFDASRPQHIQQIMWDSLKMHPDKKQFYLSKPEETSLHNYGCAVDVSIINTKTKMLLNMGTDFDFFGNLSEPIYEKQFLKTGELSMEAYENRLLLRKVMQKAKLNPITSEWWHFSICKKEEAMARYQLIK